jgi:hypothetical protein
MFHVFLKLFMEADFMFRHEILFETNVVRISHYFDWSGLIFLFLKFLWSGGINYLFEVLNVGGN